MILRRVTKIAKRRKIKRRSTKKIRKKIRKIKSHLTPSQTNLQSTQPNSNLRKQESKSSSIKMFGKCFTNLQPTLSLIELPTSQKVMTSALNRLCEIRLTVVLFSKRCITNLNKWHRDQRLSKTMIPTFLKVLKRDKKKFWIKYRANARMSKNLLRILNNQSNKLLK